jgi:hypothetical protein
MDHHITLLCSKYSTVCHDILEQIPMKDLQSHMKIMWIDHATIRDKLSETVVKTVPCIIVVNKETGDRVIYQGNDFKTYWDTFIHSHEKSYMHVNPKAHVNKLNQMHSHTMMHVDKIRQSIHNMKTTQASYLSAKQLLSDEHHGKALQARLTMHMDNNHEKIKDELAQHPIHNKVTAFRTIPKTVQYAHSASNVHVNAPSKIEQQHLQLDSITKMVEDQHSKIKHQMKHIEHAQSVHKTPLAQLKMANSLLQQTPPPETPPHQ